MQNTSQSGSDWQSVVPLGQRSWRQPPRARGPGMVVDEWPSGYLSPQIGSWKRLAVVTSRSLAENTIDTLREPLLVLDAHLRVQQLNHSFCQLFQISASDSLGRGLHELGGGQWNIGELRESLKHLLRDGHVQEFQLEHTFASLGPRTIRIDAQRLIETDSEEPFILLVLVDVTGRNALEALRREFIALMSHEMRNALASVLGSVQIMQRQESFNSERLGHVVDGARQIDGLISDLQDTLELGVGGLRFEPRWMDLVALTRTETQLAQCLSSRHGVRFHGPPGPIDGWWDPGRLSQVFANLLSNAIKYSPSGGQILVSIEDRTGDARITVRDQGLGIAPGALGRIFDRGYRAPDSTGTIRGLGLGLHVVKVLVEAHGGSITAESELGVGSIFTVTLPRR